MSNSNPSPFAQTIAQRWLLAGLSLNLLLGQLQTPLGRAQLWLVLLPLLTCMVLNRGRIFQAFKFGSVRWGHARRARRPQAIRRHDV